MRRKPIPAEVKALLKLSRKILPAALELRHASEHRRAARLRLATLHMEQVLLALDTSELLRSQDSFDRAEVDPITSISHSPLGDEVVDDVDPTLPIRNGLPVDHAGFSGSSSCIPLPALVGMLQIQAKSGLLRVVGEVETFILGFERGDLVFAYSNDPPAGTRLGELLVQRGSITKEELDQFLERHLPGVEKIGKALDREELVTKTDIRQALECQIHQLFLRAQEKTTSFTFTDGRPQEFGLPVRLGVLRLLLESARIQDEASRSSA